MNKYLKLTLIFVAIIGVFVALRFVDDVETDSVNPNSVSKYSKLDDEIQTQIQTKIDEDHRLADQKLKKDALIGECNNYYILMKNCGEDFTFEKVNEIYNWVNDTTNKHLIEDYEKFKTIKTFIQYYKDAADAIEGIDPEWTTIEWFESGNSKVLYDCFMKNTPKDGFNNNFRACIVHLLGGNSTGSPEEGKGAESINREQIYEVGFKKKVGKISDEINHTEKYSTEKKYLKVDEYLYKGINDVLQNAADITSFKDLKNIKK